VNHPFTRPRHRYWLHFEQKCRFNFSNSQITRSFETVIASAAKQSIFLFVAVMDCFAALAMTPKRAFAPSQHEAPEALMSPRTRAGSAATCQPCHLAPQRKALPCSHFVGADRKPWRDGKVELHLRCC